jgi:hypothetical protein
MKGIVNFGINNVVKGTSLNGNLVIAQKKTSTKNKQEIIKQNLIYNYLNELNYLKQKYIEKRINTYSVSKNNVKYLVIMACHCNTEYKLLTIKQSVKYLMNDSTELLIVNSFNLSHNNQLRDFCASQSNITYIEVVNDNTYDFGKWIHGLNVFNYSKYNFVMFINDSFIIHAPIDHYFNLVYKNNVEFYGYNSSTQGRYHYQSYLFSIKRESINTFVHNFNIRIGNIKNQQDVITNYELTMTDWFSSNNCFLNIANLPSHKDKNIFFTNNILYDKLKKTNLLPFTKIKSIDSSIINNINNFIVTYITTSIPINNYDSNFISIVNEANQDSLLANMEHSL